MSYVRAIYDFTGEPESSEISIHVGEILRVTRTNVGDGWWEGKNNEGKVGLFPAAYVEVISALEVRKHNLNKEDPKDICNTYNHLAHDSVDGDDWEDDWDDSNDTYSEIEPAAQNRSSDLSRYDDSPVSLNGASALNNSVPNAALKKSGMFGRSYSYILGLSVKEKLPESQIVRVIQLGNFYHWAFDHQSYSVVVASPKKESKFKGMKSFIAYQLTPSFNNIPVSRRYKHFDWLHERLVEKFCLIPIPPLPDKQISGRYEEQFIEHRRVQLQDFVDWVCRHPVLSNCEVWYHFLTCTDDKIWKSGKRKAEKDVYVGISYCWAIMPPEKQLLPSFVDSQMECCSQFVHLMDISVKNLLVIAHDTAKRYSSQCKKEFQRIGDGLSELAKALSIDERRSSSKSVISLSEMFGRVGGIYISIGQMYGDQPKLDWVPFSDRLHVYRGILNVFPDIVTIHKGAVQKRRECEKLAAEQKMGNQQLIDVNRRTDVISYAIMAEISHFKAERDIHLKEALRSLIKEQIKFYNCIVEKLQEAFHLFGE